VVISHQQSSTILLDTNIAILLVVGRASEDFISRHINIKSDFNRNDFAELERFLLQFDAIDVTPHILAEVNSLIRQRVDGDMLNAIMAAFREFIESVNEVVVASKIGSHNDAFAWAGLTDALTSEAMKSSTRTVLTNDQTLLSSLAKQGANVLGFSQISQPRY
jgi:rRNA-processing protein FCF1